MWKVSGVVCAKSLSAVKRRRTKDDWCMPEYNEAFGSKMVFDYFESRPEIILNGFKDVDYVDFFN